MRGIGRASSTAARLPVMEGVIRRRVLVNFRVDPDVMEAHLPSPFVPKLHGAHAVAGVCLIRLEEIRPKGFPRLFGIASENAAHRIAVAWEEGGETREGVFVPRRDSDSLLNHLAGGRVFPGEHHRAAFRVRDDGSRVELHVRSADGLVEVDLAGADADALPASSAFESLDAASRFFEAGSLGYSPRGACDRFEGLRLETKSWHVAPLAVERVRSSFFSDAAKFPPGSVAFDCALVMRDVAHEWHSAPELACG